MLAFTALALVSAVVVIRGSGRVTEAYGKAGDAFGERDWIVVADFEGPEDDPALALAVWEAVTIDLQQSGYVNVFSRGQMAVVLQRMEIRADTAIDSGLAREIAQREGLGAILLGKVLPLGGTYAISARVVEPHEGRELISVRATASKDFLADGVEKLSRDLRERLGRPR